LLAAELHKPSLAPEPVCNCTRESSVVEFCQFGATLSHGMRMHAGDTLWHPRSLDLA